MLKNADWNKISEAGRYFGESISYISDSAKLVHIEESYKIVGNISDINIAKGNFCFVRLGIWKRH